MVFTRNRLFAGKRVRNIYILSSHIRGLLSEHGPFKGRLHLKFLHKLEKKKTFLRHNFIGATCNSPITLSGNSNQTIAEVLMKIMSYNYKTPSSSIFMDIGFPDEFAD